MKQDKKWLLREFRKLTFELQNGYAKVKAVDILPLIDQLDEPEKVEPLVVPKDLVDFLVCRPIGEEAFLITMIQDLREFWSDTIEGQDLHNFITDNKKEIIEVILGNRSYEVEKEKLYVVELSNSNEKFINYQFDNYENVFLNKRDGIVFIDSCRLSINDIKKYIQFGLTEKEIKDYDERFWPFAVEVTE
ncbi:DUF1642 domain-containing protein [Jeotgalibaca porci]|uniref:DUF1642 domain-containing protein n=1 Tax=Jeotgalibaca porci TaxID=1868793 RepID=UPI0035A05399